MDSVKLDEYSTGAATQNLQHHQLSTHSSNFVTTISNNNHNNNTNSTNSHGVDTDLNTNTTDPTTSNVSSTPALNVRQKPIDNDHDDDRANNHTLLISSETSHKSICCASICAASKTTTTSLPAMASTLQTCDISREPWYPHHHHHHHAHPHPHHVHHGAVHTHQQMPEELVMYSPAASTAIGKYSLESSTDGYLNPRFNVNVKGVRHERTSSFFDIPAVTHPYCYRFQTTPPAGILKKCDEDAAFCHNSGVTPATNNHHHHHHHHHAHHTTFQHTKVEHADSTSHLNMHHAPSSQLSHHHHHPHVHQQHHHQQQPPPQQHQATALHSFKFSHPAVSAATPASVYQHYTPTQGIMGSPGGTNVYTLRTDADLAATSLSLHQPMSSTDICELKYDNSPYNATISSSYAALQRSNTAVDSSTSVAAVSSTDSDLLKFDNFYGSNSITTSSQNVTQRRGSLQLWQFLVALLDEPSNSSNCIAWTGRGMEFKLIEPEEVARRWGIQKNRPAMNYDKLSRSLRYYYEKGIMQKVNGERYVYRFVCDPDALFNMAYGNLNGGKNENLTSHASQNHHYNHNQQSQNLLQVVSKTDLTLTNEQENSREPNSNNGKSSENVFYSNQLDKF